MSYGPDDVVRSTRRYLTTILPFPWIEDLERNPILDEDRPAAVIEAGEHAVSDFRTTVPQGGFTLTMPITMTFYPSLPADDGGAREAGRTARRLSHAIELLFVQGCNGVPEDDPPVPGMGPTGVVLASGRPASGPMRLPLWDWDDVALIGTPEERTGPIFPIAVVSIESASAHAIQDDQEARRWTVVCELRVSWRVPGAPGPDAPLVTSMPQTGRMVL